MFAQPFRSRFLNVVGSLILFVLLLGLVACRPAADSVVEPAQSGPEAEPTVAAEPAAETAAGPVATTSAFYDWYLGYLNPLEGRNPLVDGAYRNNDYLSAGYLARVDALLEEMRDLYGGIGYDPFLHAQDIPQGYTVEAWEEGAGEACAIVHKEHGQSVHDLTVNLIVEEGAWKIDNIRAGSPATPDGVARLFLADYLEETKAAMRSGEQGPLQCGAYRDSRLLSPAFVAQVDETVAGFEQSAYDPFLLAQDVPHALNFGEAVVQGDSATVQVGRTYAGTPQPTYFRVELGREEGRWLITAVRPLAEPDLPAGTAPEAVVETFYGEWVEAVQAGFASGENPLMGRSYADSPYVAPAFVAQVDETVAGFEGGGYDPFLCAQDVPTNLEAEGVIYTTSGARVPVRTSFEGHAFVVELQQAGDSWQITEVVCPGTPDSNAAIFYTWYLAYSRDCCVMGMTDPGMMRNPLVDGAYHNAPYINPAFAAEVDAQLAKMRAEGGAGHDPILQAQAFPPDFSIRPGEDAGAVVVDMHFANEHLLDVQMEQVDGRWLVSGVSRLEAAGAPVQQAETSDWTTVVDEAHGFSFQIPPGWEAVAQDLDGPGMPDDWPVLAQYLLMPAEMAARQAAQSGPPDPDAAPLIPPFAVTYLEGDGATFNRVYVPAESIDILELGGQSFEVQRQGGDYLMPRYILLDAERWLVVEDAVGEFPGREAQAAEVQGILGGILSSVSLDG